MKGRHRMNINAKKHFLSWEAIKDWFRKYTDDGIEGLKNLQRGNGTKAT
jgi:transposase